MKLYNSLMDIALRKQDEIRKLIANTIRAMREDLLEKAQEYDFICTGSIPAAIFEPRTTGSG